MWQMIAFIFIAAFVICLVKVWMYWVTSCALMKYIEDKLHTRPSKKEIGACVDWVIRKIFHLGRN